MKRRIKALGILLSDFYNAHENEIDTTIMAIFIIIGAIVLSSCVWKNLKPVNFSQDEIKYAEEKVTEIATTNDIRVVTSIIKEMKEKGYVVNWDYEDETIKIDREESRQVAVIFSYSSPTKISKEFSASKAEFNQAGWTSLSIVGGVIVGFLIWIVMMFVFSGIADLLNILSKIRNKYKKALEKVDSQNKCNKESESESIEQKEAEDD